MLTHGRAACWLFLAWCACGPPDPMPIDGGLDAPVRRDTGLDAPRADCAIVITPEAPEGFFQCSPEQPCQEGVEVCCLLSSPGECTISECRSRVADLSDCDLAYTCLGPRDCAIDERCCINGASGQFCIPQTRACEGRVICDTDADCPSSQPCCVTTEASFCIGAGAGGVCPS